MKKNYENKSVKLLEELKEKIIIGYTHENYVSISNIIKELEFYLDYEDLVYLKDAWRDSYTDSCDLDNLNNKIEFIKQYI